MRKFVEKQKTWGIPEKYLIRIFTGFQLVISAIFVTMLVMNFNEFQEAWQQSSKQQNQIKQQKQELIAHTFNVTSTDFALDGNNLFINGQKWHVEFNENGTQFTKKVLLPIETNEDNSIIIYSPN